jgi:hypothetical protein
MPVDKSFQTFTNVDAGTCCYPNLGGTISPRNYPTEESRSKMLPKVNLNEIAVNISQVIRIELS